MIETETEWQSFVPWPWQSTPCMSEHPCPFHWRRKVNGKWEYKCPSAEDIDKFVSSDAW